MNIYLVARPPSDRIEYDEYSRFVVCCADAQTARTTHPSNRGYSPIWDEATNSWHDRQGGVDSYHLWTNDLASLEVALLGPAEANVPSNTVICSSFHAG